MSKKINITSHLIIIVLFISFIVPLILISVVSRFTINDLNDYFKGISVPIWIIIFASSKLYHKYKIEDIERLRLNDINNHDPDVLKDAKRNANISIQKKIDKLPGLKSASNNLDKALGFTGIIGALFGIILYILIQVF